MLEGKPAKAAKAYKKLTTFVDGLDDAHKLGDVRKNLAQRLEVAEEVETAARRMANADPAANANVMNEATGGEMEQLARKPKLDLIQEQRSLTK